MRHLGRLFGLEAESGEKSLSFVPAFLPGMWMQCPEAQQLSCEHEDEGYALKCVCLGCCKDFGSKLTFESLVHRKIKSLVCMKF